jgi:hypothetical protein
MYVSYKLNVCIIFFIQFFLKKIKSQFNSIMSQIKAAPEYYPFFLSKWNCKFSRVTLERWSEDRSILLPILPRVGFMFVHWTADDNKEHWRDFYEVSTDSLHCACCASCWLTYNRGCIIHGSGTWGRPRVPVSGFDWVTYEDHVKYDWVKLNWAEEPGALVEHMPRRSTREKKQTQFYYGY